ncbi:MAG: hypothetical protein MI743_03860 [Sneathiellales bacterium]|nr:hypothetical protein [Sneathiellales bacterium]
MSDKPAIESVAERYLQLWQRQLTYLAQNPDQGFQDLLQEGQRMAQGFAARHAGTKEDQDDKG